MHILMLLDETKQRIKECFGEDVTLTEGRAGRYGDEAVEIQNPYQTLAKVYKRRKDGQLAIEAIHDLTKPQSDLIFELGDTYLE